MKNVTTLSLITTAILGLNGCGSSTTPTAQVESNDTKEIALGIINTYSTQVDDKVALSEALQTALENNQAQLEANLLTTSEAMAESKNYVESAYANLQAELADDLNSECQDDQACLEVAYASIATPLALSHEEAYAIAQDLRAEAKGLVNDKLVENFTCKEGLMRTVQHYGVEDLFSTANGAETAQASNGVLTTSWIQNYPYPVTAYDETSNDRIFADTVNNLPSGITQGMFYIGLKSNGSSLQGNDTIKIGDYATVTLMNSQLTDLSSIHSWNNQLVSSTNPTTDIYYQSFSNINLSWYAS